MSVQRQSKPLKTAHPKPSTKTAPTEVPAPSCTPHEAYQRCGPACVRPTPSQAPTKTGHAASPLPLLP